MSKSFSNLSQRTQVQHMRGHALDFLLRWGIRPDRLRLLNHGFNTAFSVEVGEKRYALRINVNSVHSEPEIWAEAEWLHHLHLNSELHVPRVIQSNSGAEVEFQEWSGGARPLAAILFEWIEGPLLDDRENVAAMRVLGQATRTLHENALSVRFSPRASLKVITDCMVGESPEPIWETKAEKGLYLEVMEEANAVLARLAKDPPRPIHYDLHMSNMKWHKNRLSIFDFDDCLLGWPVLDPAVTLWYLRSCEDSDALEAAYWDGFQGDPGSMGVSVREFESLVAARSVLLAQAIAVATTPDLRALIPRYIDNTNRRLAHFQKAGRYVHKLDA
jgi:Ser/Thr protein kinase RdoA (MazF antagonist)